MKQQKDSYVAYKPQDNWREFSYDYRCLDALASIFHIQSAVTATVEVDNLVYLSYSNDALMVPSVKYIFDFIKQITNGVYSTPDHLLAIYLIYNVDFNALIKLAKRFIGSVECKEALNKLVINIKDTSNDLDKALKKGNKAEEIFYKDGNKIVSLYKTILTDYHDDIQEYLDRFLRPIQDVYKLHYHFHSLSHDKKIEDIIILPNPHAIHADTNIVANFPNNIGLIEKQYIGVSKLCCGYCHTYLDKNNYEHRGTHGVCDDQWGFPWLDKYTKFPLEEKFKDSVKSVGEFDIKNPPSQHRKLSFDFFEKDIPFSEEKTLWDLKVDLGFIKKSKPAKLEQNLSLIEEPNIESYLVDTSGDHHIDPNVLKVIGGGSELWECSEDLYC